MLFTAATRLRGRWTGLAALLPVVFRSLAASRCLPLSGIAKYAIPLIIQEIFIA
jgi:hypothetical protein